jgi:deoxyribodipyrimidine photolyase-related protein
MDFERHGPWYLGPWYLAIYVDAVEWVEGPNTLGMSQYADGGLYYRYFWGVSGGCAAARRHFSGLSTRCDEPAFQGTGTQDVTSR